MAPTRGGDGLIESLTHVLPHVGTAAVIMIDYILVMTFLCAAVVIYHNLFEMKAGLSWCARSPVLGPF